MHIAMIGQKGMPAIHGGVERHVHDLSVCLVAEGHTVDVYARRWYTNSVTTDIEGVSIIHTKTIHTKHLDTITHTFTATIAAMRSTADIIHYHGVGPSLLSWIPRIFSNKRVVNTFHSIDRKHEKWGIFAKIILTLGEWASCTFAHQTIAVSRTIQQYSRDVYNANVAYIPNGVPLMKRVQTIAALRAFNLKKDSYIIALSRLIKHKGMHYLVEAYMKLLETNPEILNGKKLVIVGDGYYTDSYVQSLKDLAKGNQNIIFTGFQSGIGLAELLSHAHLYVHPSDNEGLPITVLEAMSYGIPTLVSDIPEHRELISESDCQFTASNVDSLIEGLTRMCRNTTIRKSSSKKNRETIKHVYTWNIVVQDIIALYTKVLSDNEASKQSVQAILHTVKH